MEMIKYEGYFLEDGKMKPEATKVLSEAEAFVKEINKQYKALKDRLQAEMELNGLIKVVNDDVSIAYVDSFERESLDTKKLKEELRDIYDAYVKVTKVAPTIKITLRKKK